LFCENCGLQFFPRQSVCTRCEATCTRHWLQLTSLTTLLIAAVCNSLASMLLPASALARSAASNRGSSFAPTLKASAIAVWLWIDGRASLYGWAALALALLTWDYFAWPEWRPALKERIKRWVIRSLLVSAFLVPIVPFFPRWIRPPAGLLLIAAKLPWFPIPMFPTFSAAVPWATVALAAALLCMNAETRDSLLGRGRALSVASLGVLLTVLTFTLLAFIA
jgi:hypothetical protein